MLMYSGIGPHPWQNLSRHLVFGPSSAPRTVPVKSGYPRSKKDSEPPEPPLPAPTAGGEPWARTSRRPLGPHRVESRRPAGRGSRTTKKNKVRALPGSKNHSTQDSHVVPHHGTNWAALRLTSQIGRDAVLSESYGRGCLYTRPRPRYPSTPQPPAPGRTSPLPLPLLARPQAPLLGACPKAKSKQEKKGVQP